MLPRELEPLREHMVSHERGRFSAQAQPLHERVYKDLPPLGLTDASTFEEGGATIMVCTAQKQEYCGHCCCDYHEMNDMARRDAAADYADVDVADPDIASSFIPSQM